MIVIIILLLILCFIVNISPFFSLAQRIQQCNEGKKKVKDLLLELAVEGLPLLLILIYLLY